MIKSKQAREAQTKIDHQGTEILSKRTRWQLPDCQHSFRKEGEVRWVTEAMMRQGFRKTVSYRCVNVCRQYVALPVWE